MRQNISFKTRKRKDCLQKVSVIGSLVRILCWVSSSAVTIAITLSLAVALAYGWYYSQCAQNIALKTTCPYWEAAALIVWDEENDHYWESNAFEPFHFTGSDKRR